MPTLTLSCIQSIDRGCGDGSAGLDWFMQMAKKHSVRVSGSVKQLGGDGLTRSQLKLWYKRHGLEVSRSGELAFDPAVQRARDVVDRSQVLLGARSGARSKAP